MEFIRGVRPMTVQDIEAVAGLEQACFSESWPESMIRSGLDSRLDTYFVYEDHGRILGYSVIRVLADEGEIQRVAVEPRFRRLGIARKLMEAMVGFSRMRGVRAITLEVRRSNEGARKLYDFYGFREEALRRGYYRNPTEDAVIMWNRQI
ncbi:MAG: ribosomal protein S18-alanine N-acetyltransferase [Clostridium sp.]|nr:ribosomal protein S18-alanine N-acetyltransferase [Clostridium sp.]